jgi:hypothetical protein
MVRYDLRYDLSLREAAAELITDPTIDQADAILKRKLFQKTLEEARKIHNGLQEPTRRMQAVQPEPVVIRWRDFQSDAHRLRTPTNLWC